VLPPWAEAGQQAGKAANDNQPAEGKKKVAV
jgi:hypothetical protein